MQTGTLEPGGLAGQIHSWTLGGQMIYFIVFHVRSLLTLLFAIGNISSWGAWSHGPFGFSFGAGAAALPTFLLVYKIRQ